MARLRHEACLADELDSSDCPVCLGVLFEPVAPACGHPICRECYEGLRQSATQAPQCPICRRSVSATPRGLPIVGAAVRADNRYGTV